MTQYAGKNLIPYSNKCNMAGAEKVVDGGLSCVNDMKFGGEYGTGNVKAADIPEIAYPEVRSRRHCLRFRYDELCGEKNRNISAEVERNGNEKEQREISCLSRKVSHEPVMIQELIEQIRALFSSYTQDMLEKDHGFSMHLLELMGIFRAAVAQNYPLRQILPPGVRRLKKDTKENKLQSSVLEQTTSVNELSSGSEVQYEKKTSYNLSESDVNTSVEPGDKLESGMQDEEIDKSKKPDTADTESKKKEKPKFAEPVHVTTDKCNFKLLQCPLMIWCIYLLLFSKVCVKADGAVMKDTSYSCYDSESAGRSVQDYDKETVCHIPYLKSSRCDASADDTCPTSDFNYNLLANMHCQYECGVREDLVCLNTVDGLRFVCLPEDINCPKGFGWRISSNNSNGFLEIILGQCQDGFYQESMSRCYDACKDQHFSPDHIPDGLILYRKGDSSHPQLLMCDYTMGYYNPDNKTSIRADSQLQFTIGGFCVDSPNPCSGEQMPLHNGTCVNHCKDGFERDPTDFICKQKIAKRNGSTVTPEQPPALTSTAQNDSPYTVQDNKHVPSTDKTKNITNKVDDEKKTLEKVILGIVILVGVSGLLIKCFVAYIKNKKQNSSNRNEQNAEPTRNLRTRTENGNTHVNVGDGATVNIFNERVPNMSDNPDETLLKSMIGDSGSLDGAEELSQEAASTLGTRL